VANGRRIMRIGLKGETETDTLPLKVLGVGARIYTMSDSAFKIFIEPALAWEFEGGAGMASYQLNNPQYKKDMIVHLAAGAQLDFAPSTPNSSFSWAFRYVCHDMRET
jgi:hypothetical protein